MGTTISHNPEETYRAGFDAAAALSPGEVLALVGELGAGKTQWVKGLAAGLGSDAVVTSPTFTLIHEYGGGRLPLCHIDCYRLDAAAELLGIGLDDFMDGRAILAIEWADKFPELIPGTARWVRFVIGDGDVREIMKDE